jgi:hypothetical protein
LAKSEPVDPSVGEQSVIYSPATESSEYHSAQTNAPSDEAVQLKKTDSKISRRVKERYIAPP